ncbi:hypothetical protein Pelo_1282 [Pelomyxa schiedti]|nr:hypothetical protein Pelo_1282 [Pelomyxa schiedti]
MAFLVWTTRVFFLLLLLSVPLGVFPPPTLSQLGGFTALSLWLLAAKCCSLVLKSMIPLQQFYLGSAGAASASAHWLPFPWVLPMIQLRLLKCHWLLSCVFGFSPG